MSSENDASLWSTCSNEDMTALLSKNPQCLTAATSANIPQAIPVALSASECKMPSFLSDVRGVHSYKLNGMKMNLTPWTT